MERKGVILMVPFAPQVLSRLFLIAILLVVGSIFSASPALAALKCAAIFNPKVEDYIPELLYQIRLGEMSLERQGVSSSIKPSYESLGWYRARKLRALLGAEMGRFPSERALMVHIHSMSTLLFGQRNQVQYWLKTNKDQRQQDRIVEALRQTLLNEGLSGYWRSEFNSKNISWAHRQWDRVEGVFSHRYAQILRLPFLLPNIQGKALPKKLVMKIAKEGLDKHWQEAQSFLKTQSRIETYQTVQRYYFPSVLGVVFAYHFYLAFEDLQMQKAMAEKAAKDFQQTIGEVSGVVEGVQSIIQEIYMEAFEAALDEFVLVYGEDPTTAEYEELKIRVAQDIGISPAAVPSFFDKE